MWQLETMFWLHIISTRTNTHTREHTHIRVRHADKLEGYTSKGHCLEPVETKVASGKAARKAVKAKDTTKLPHADAASRLTPGLAVLAACAT